MFLYCFIKYIINFFFFDQSWIMQDIPKCVLIIVYLSFIKC